MAQGVSPPHSIVASLFPMRVGLLNHIFLLQINVESDRGLFPFFSAEGTGRVDSCTLTSTQSQSKRYIDEPVFDSSFPTCDWSGEVNRFSSDRRISIEFKSIFRLFFRLSTETESKQQ